MERQYLCIDLKSFYASVECAERGLDPMKTNLVVADPERNEGTICLAVSPAMKALGVKNRCRVFEIPKNIEYIKAVPRMKLYIDYSAEIYGIYLKYISSDDIHIYSIDEAFLDVTHYLSLYKMTARQLGDKIRADILDTVGITAACGIGTNLYLAKVALDITAKHSKTFCSELDEEKYKTELWDHTPLTDFWRIGPGIAKRLNSIGVFTMRDIAKCPERYLYKLFGVDAEILIDHANGREPTTIADIKAYKSKNHCITSGQVLPRDYSFEECHIIVKEMADLLSLELFDKGLQTASVTLSVGYTRKSSLPHSGGTQRLAAPSNSQREIVAAVSRLYLSITDKNTPVRRVNLCFNNVEEEGFSQLDFFTDYEEIEQERNRLKAINEIRKKYGKNAILKGMNLQEAATTRERNRQIGGHKSGES